MSNYHEVYNVNNISKVYDIEILGRQSGRKEYIMSSIKSIMEVHEQKKSLIISQFSNAMAYAETQESFNNFKAQMQKELDALNEYTINRIQENYMI